LAHCLDINSSNNFKKNKNMKTIKNLGALLLAAGIMVSSVAMAAPASHLVKKQATKEKKEVVKKSDKTVTKADGTKTEKSSKKTMKSVKTTPAKKHRAGAKKHAGSMEKSK
jgi:hypothetical protein